MEEVIDLNEETLAYSSHRKKNTFSDFETDEYSFRDFVSDSEDVTINFIPSNGLSPARSPFLIDVPRTKRSRVLIISCDTE